MMSSLGDEPRQSGPKAPRLAQDIDPDVPSVNNAGDELLAVHRSERLKVFSGHATKSKPIPHMGVVARTALALYRMLK